MDTEKATFGAGCFWGVEATFRQQTGVKDVTVGYMGGDVGNPSYREVCSGRTGHAEVVQVEYDPRVVSFEDLLRTFWRCHNPTQVNRQGPDVGSQYRSVIFFHDDEQRELAEEFKAQLNESERHSLPVATSIEPVAHFWMAEEYHQRYLEKRSAESCHVP